MSLLTLRSTILDFPAPDGAWTMVNGVLSATAASYTVSVASGSMARFVRCNRVKSMGAMVAPRTVSHILL